MLNKAIAEASSWWLNVIKAYASDAGEQLSIDQQEKFLSGMIDFLNNSIKTNGAAIIKTTAIPSNELSTIMTNAGIDPKRKIYPYCTEMYIDPDSVRISFWGYKGSQCIYDAVDNRIDKTIVF